MAWNQPGNNGQDRDPWGSSKPGGDSGGNKGGRDQGPPDLDDIFRKLSKKLGGLGGGKSGGPVLVVVLRNFHVLILVAAWLASLLPWLSLFGLQLGSIPLKKLNVVW